MKVLILEHSCVFIAADTREVLLGDVGGDDKNYRGKPSNKNQVQIIENFHFMYLRGCTITFCNLIFLSILRILRSL
jgi:hypothetical protein